MRRRTRGRFDDPGSSGNDARDALLGEDRLGDGGVTGAELAKMGSRVAARHLMTLLAHGGGEGTREARLAQVGDLVITLDRPELVRHVLLDLPEAGRIVDIYPLEVLAYVLERRPDLLEDMGFGDVVLDKTRLERRVYRPDETIVLGVALALRMRAFALEGGGAPGYCFQPGPPGEYHLTFGEAGVHRLLMRGEVHGRSTVDRVVLQVADG